MVIQYNNGEEKVENEININNIRNTISKLKNKKNPRMLMIDNSSDYISNDSINYDKITKESFSNILDNKPIELLVFLSNSCPHCIRYEKEVHENLSNELKNRCTIRRIYSNNDNNDMFNKYNIEYVPKGILLSEDRYVPIEGALNKETIIKYLEKINN